MKRKEFMTINIMAQFNVEQAVFVIMGVNMALGTNYKIMNKRVVWEDENGKMHDAWATAEE